MRTDLANLVAGVPSQCKFVGDARHVPRNPSEAADRVRGVVHRRIAVVRVDVHWQAPASESPHIPRYRPAGRHGVAVNQRAWGDPEQGDSLKCRARRAADPIGIKPKQPHASHRKRVQSWRADLRGF